MKEISWSSEYEKIISVLDGSGAFLTVKSRSADLNTMTIGWGSLGIMWDIPVFMVAVRPSRYTFRLIEDADNFTVTLPFSDMSEQLMFCGTHSGKDIDKIKGGNLITLPAQKVSSPIIEAKSARYYECKIVQATAMDRNKISSEHVQKFYQDSSCHTYYFGEIVSCYEK